jgi:phage tail-like protein
VPGVSERICRAGFAECDGLEASMGIRTLHEGGVNDGVVHSAGPVSYGQVVLRRGMTDSPDLWAWFEAVQADPGLRADAHVAILAADCVTERARFTLERCLPAHVRGPALDARRGLIAIEELGLAYERLVLRGDRRRARVPDRDRSVRPNAQVTRARLLELDAEPHVVEVQFNPATLRVTHGFEEDAGRTTLRMTLCFDATNPPLAGARRPDVRRFTDRVAHFMTPRSATGAPRAVRLEWGAFRFDGTMAGLDVTFDYFAPDGRALRALLDLSLTRRAC